MQQESGLPLADSNSDPRRFPCTQCGASLEYAPAPRCSAAPTAVMKSHRRRPASIEEQDFRQTLRDLANTATVRKRFHPLRFLRSLLQFRCRRARRECPFCDAPVVAKPRHRELQIQALLPFKIGRDQARAAIFVNGSKVYGSRPASSGLRPQRCPPDRHVLRALLDLRHRHHHPLPGRAR